MNKKTKRILTSTFFLIVVILHVYGLLGHEMLAFYTKPFLMISLVLVYLGATKKANFWYVSAVFFSFWGDVFLLFKEQFFIHGLASFLFAHVLYIKISAEFLKKINLQKAAFISVPFVIFLVGLIFLIKDSLGEMLFPVIIYGITISSFGAVTLLNYLQKKTTENLWLFLGAIIFMASDNLIAINKFYEPKEFYGITIMLTYIIAQYLICKAMIVKDSSL
ncbi:lysoplasmalogenase [Polaribacter marinus]|nr:lysoplasmalogenase [Polaribacter marinus]